MWLDKICPDELCKIFLLFIKLKAQAECLDFITFGAQTRNKKKELKDVHFENIKDL